MSANIEVYELQLRFDREPENSQTCWRHFKQSMNPKGFKAFEQVLEISDENFAKGVRFNIPKLRTLIATITADEAFII